MQVGGNWTDICEKCGESWMPAVEGHLCPKKADKIPRRIRLDLATPAEIAIRAAVDAVEKAGADVLLTDAVILLGQAREKVADFIDKRLKETEF